MITSVVLTSRQCVLLLTFAGTPPNGVKPSTRAGCHFSVNEWVWAKEPDASSIVALTTPSLEYNLFVICASFVNSSRSRTMLHLVVHLKSPSYTVSKLSRVIQYLLSYWAQSPDTPSPSPYTSATLNDQKTIHSFTQPYLNYVVLGSIFCPSSPLFEPLQLPSCPNTASSVNPQAELTISTAIGYVIVKLFAYSFVFYFRQ